MVWAGFSYNGTTYTAFFKNRKCFDIYQTALKARSTITSMWKVAFVRQMDIPATPLFDSQIKIYNPVFRQNQVNVVDWPVLSLDMYPIENLCKRLARDVYMIKTHQFATIQDLKLQFERTLFFF